MQEIRCKSCNKLLGKFDGIGEIKCPRAGCNMVNKFNTEKKIRNVDKPHSYTSMGNRTTSSDVTFQ